MRQVERIAAFIKARVPPDDLVVLAGDFNDWGERLGGPIRAMGLRCAEYAGSPPQRTFPSRLPLFSLDRIYARGLRCVGTHVPRGPVWARMSDHLPLVAELELAFE